MKKFKVTITETLEKEVEVEAEDRYEAEQIVRDEYGRSDHILNSDYFIGADFMAEEIAPEKIKVVILEPDKVARVAEIGTELEDLQRVVGGYIEVYPCSDDPDCCFILNEEGKIKGLPLNRAVYGADGKIADIIAGTAFICDGTGENFGSLSEEKLEKYSEKFKLPEKFYRTDEGIMAVPYQPKDKNIQR